MHAQPLFVRTTFLLLFAPCVALAQGGPAPPADELAVRRPRPTSVALLAGYGYSENPDSLGLGAGVRVGYSTPGGLYVGGTAVYHLGGRKGLELRDDGGNDVVDSNSAYAGFEAGLNLEVGPFLMRPYLGLGAHLLRTKRETYVNGAPGTVRSTDFGPYASPGISALYPTGSLFVGADARYLFTPLELGARGVALFGTIGTSFLAPRLSPPAVRRAARTTGGRSPAPAPGRIGSARGELHRRRARPARESGSPCWERPLHRHAVRWGKAFVSGGSSG
jgi:hypothetical protein